MTIDTGSALRYIRGETTEEELRAGIRPTEGEIIGALKHEVARLRRENDELAEDLRAALTEIDKLSGRN